MRASEPLAMAWQPTRQHTPGPKKNFAMVNKWSMLMFVTQTVHSSKGVAGDAKQKIHISRGGTVLTDFFASVRRQRPEGELALPNIRTEK